MKNNKEISPEDLTNYAYGLASPKKSKIIKEALLYDEDVRNSYKGIIQLMNDYPDKDPMEILENMNIELGAGLENLIKTGTPIKKIGNRKSTNKGWNFILSVAATVIVLIVSGYLITKQFSAGESNVELKQLAMKEIDKPYYPDNERGNVSNESKQWKELFFNENYKEVIKIISEKNNRTNEEQFFIGLAFLKIKEYSSAEYELIKAAKPNQLYESDAWFYLGITQVLQNKDEKAKTSFKKTENHSKAEQFLKLMK